MPPCIILRAYNDMPLIADTLAMIAKQDIPYELIAFDNASTDGTTEEIRKYTDRIVNIPAGTYVPGRVLNQAMEESSGELVVFLNSDCTPQHPEWLKNLLAGFRQTRASDGTETAMDLGSTDELGGTNERIAAVFGRQIPRPDCHLLYAKDTEATFGDGALQKYWKHCFSMASSAIRRSVWEQMRFNEDIQYSEDIDWTWRIRQQGYEIQYVADSIVMHSHNYTLRQWYRRQYGEGRAEAVIFDWSKWERSFMRYSVMPYGRQVLSDWKYCAKKLAIGPACYSPLMRIAQLLGRRKGFRDGWNEKSR